MTAAAISDVEPEHIERVHLGSVNVSGVFENTGQPEAAWYQILTLDGGTVKFKLDTGADVSVITENTWRRLTPRPRLKQVKSKLLTPSGPLSSCGEFIARTGGSHFRIIVAPTASENLLDRTTAVRMGFIKRVDEIVDTDIFGDIGLVSCEPVKIILKNDAQPYSVTTPRRIPIPMEAAVETELERMGNLGIIRAISEPTLWCAPMVPVVKRNGRIRICVDLKRLNESVKREMQMLPTIDDILHKLSGSTVFTKLDASAGFWQIPLDRNSAKYTTFITPFGRYCFLRLPFGITSAPEIFQRKMEEILKDLSGVHVIMDDILIHGANDADHDTRLAAALTKIKKSGLKLNKEKCLFRQNELQFLGHTIGIDGVKPDPEKTRAILELKAPTNVTELRQFLGIVNYLGRFLPNLSQVTQPLNELRKNDRAWIWDSAQQEAFIKVKDMITSTPVLAFYQLGKPTLVSADASSYGIGGVIMQLHNSDWKPVAFCSRTLSEAERKYAQLEKECLAAVWTCERFSRYLCGLPTFKLLTDHKPLVPLINTKDLDQVPLRCQRLLIRMMRYNPKAVYTPGKDLVIADALSRNPLAKIQPDSNLEKEVEAHVAAIVADIPATPSKLALIRQETQTDPQLQTALQYTMSGWPKYASDVKPEARELFAVRAELSVSDGLLIRGKRIVIPQTLRDEMLNRIHDGHLGLSKCRKRAQDALWWPGITVHIKKKIEMCAHCSIHKPSQRKEPLQTTPLPDRPWQRVAADLCELRSQHYLVVADYFSRWIEIMHLTSTMSRQIITKLKGVYARFGVPEQLITDNCITRICRICS